LERKTKNTQCTELVTKIALFNKWKYDIFVSNNNKSKKHLRTIFKIGRGRNIYYLSIDIENGCFELFKRDRVFGFII